MARNYDVKPFLLLNDVFILLKAELKINSLRNVTSVSNREVGNKTRCKLCLTFILHIFYKFKRAACSVSYILGRRVQTSLALRLRRQFLTSLYF